MAILAFFLVAYLPALYLAGIRLNWETSLWFWEYLDLELLSTDPFRSLYYMHQQPPMFNSVLAAAIFVFGLSGYKVGLYLWQYALTLLNAFIVYRIFLHFAGKRASLLCALIYLCLPSVILFTNWFASAVTMQFLLNLLLLSLCSHNQRRGFLGAAISLTLLSLTHAIFHPFLIIVILSVLVYLNQWRGLDRRFLSLGFLVLLLPTLLVAKNYYLFKVPALNSWGGINLGWVLDEDPGMFAAVRNRLVEQPFEARHGVLALTKNNTIRMGNDYRMGSDSLDLKAHFNWNNEKIPHESVQVGRAALSRILDRPGDYARKVFGSIRRGQGLFSSEYNCCGTEFGDLRKLTVPYRMLMAPLSPLRPLFNYAYFLLFPVLILAFGKHLFPAADKQLVFGLRAVSLMALSFILIIHAFNGKEQERLRFFFEGYYYVALAGMIVHTTKRLVPRKWRSRVTGTDSRAEAGGKPATGSFLSG